MIPKSLVFLAKASQAKQWQQKLDSLGGLGNLALKEDGSIEEEAAEDTAVVLRPKRPRTRSIAANEPCKSTGILL